MKFTQNVDTVLKLKRDRHDKVLPTKESGIKKRNNVELSQLSQLT